MFAIDRAGDGGGEDDAATLLQPREGVTPVGKIRADIGAGDRHQPPTRREAVQRRGDMAKACVGDTA